MAVAIVVAGIIARPAGDGGACVIFTRKQSGLWYNSSMPIDDFIDMVNSAMGRRMSRRDLIRRGLRLGLSLPVISGVLAACGREQANRIVSSWQPPAAAPPTGAATLTPAPLVAETQPEAAQSGQPVVVAAIGDYGLAGEPAWAVAETVKSWQPDCIITLGDNNYPDGAAATIDANIGQYYQQFIHPYQGSYGPGAEQNRFFPCLGNHDWVVADLSPYLDYFSLPHNERYYYVDRGPLRLCALDSMPGEPDGVEADSIQATWLRETLAASTAAWNIVYMHHPPYSSGMHGSSEWMRWPFQAWGADLVLAGHDHTYERIIVDGLTYLVNGLGGGARYERGNQPVAGSQVFFNADHGALHIAAGTQQLAFQFVTRNGVVVDYVQIDQRT